MLDWGVWKHLTTKSIRTALGFVLGTAVAVNEFFIRATPREIAVLFSLALLSGTFALLADERKR